MLLNRFSILLLFIFATLFSCAIQVPPQGGQQDRTPPVLVKAVPASQSTGFTAREIVFDFDENIQLKDLNNQLLVSPPLQKMPVAKVRKNKLLIQIDDTLEANSTYCFNFGNAIADLNEGNSIPDFNYVVSTGAVIDTFQLSGIVTRAEDLQPESGALVMLYDEVSDSLPYNKPPRYFSRTAKDGAFTINNIAAGTYRIFSLKESNANYLVDDPAERIAFDTTLIRVPEQTKFNLSSFQKLQHPVFVKASNSIPGRIQAIFTQPTNADSIHWLTDQGYLGLQFPSFNLSADTLDFWYTQPDADTAAFTVRREQKLDTVLLTLKKRKDTKNNPPAIDFSCGTAGFQSPAQPLALQFSTPLLKTDTAMIQLQSDSVRIPYQVKSAADNVRKLNIEVKWEEGKNYRLLFLPGAFRDIFGNTNDTLEQRITVREKSDYGTLKINFYGIPAGSQKILQVVDDKDFSVASSVFTGDTTCYFEYLSPSKLRLKMIDDINRNGKWDTGDDLKHLQPEKVRYYADPVPVRANWDVEIKWQLKSE